MRHWWWAGFMVLGMAACEDQVVEREVGYKGQARANPWLAAERFAEARGYVVRSTVSWEAPGGGDGIWLMPAEALTNEVLARRTGEWVADGGHLVLLVEHADPAVSDWRDGSEQPVVEPTLERLLGRAGLRLMENPRGAEVRLRRLRFVGREFEVRGESRMAVSAGGGEPGGFASARHGEGRISVVADGRLLRNRWIGDHDHAALWDAMLGEGRQGGRVGVLRGTRVSFWELVGRHLWPLVVSGGVVLILWLWKSLRRFGPVAAAEPPSELRGYDHHLEALGDFHWRLDRGASLLEPLRGWVIEHGQRVAVRAGHGGGRMNAYLAERAGLPVERVSMALSHAPCADPEGFTRVTADLQKMKEFLQFSQTP